jgi:hypothetical protein
MRTAKTERYVRCLFSDAELLAISKTMSQHVSEREQAENDKKRMSKQFDAQIASADAQIASASEKVRTGYEYRNVPCSVQFDQPKRNWKSIIRDDTGEIVEVAEMNESERQEELPIASEAEAATKPKKKG